MEKKKTPTAHKNNLKVINAFFYFEMWVHNRLICKPCQHSNEVNTLILIFTVPSNSFAKKVIRVAYGWLLHITIQDKLCMLYLIGTTNDDILTSQVKQEHVNFGDIIQFIFYETYLNLTLKTLLGLKSGQLDFVVTHISL